MARRPPFPPRSVFSRPTIGSFPDCPNGYFGLYDPCTTGPAGSAGTVRWGWSSLPVLVFLGRGVRRTSLGHFLGSRGRPVPVLASGQSTVSAFPDIHIIRWASPEFLLSATPSSTARIPKGTPPRPRP
jgi:hypothetical protein